MPANETSICNQALGLLGSTTIMSLDDESQAARFCKLFYEQTRDEVIAGHRWNFAIKRADLSQLVETPANEWTIMYSLPSDCLRVLQLNGFDETEDAKRWSVEAGKLLTDEGSASIKYLGRIDNAAIFPPLFIEALSVKLASKIAQPITGSRQLPQELMTEYRRITGPEARKVDAFEGRLHAKPAWVTSSLVQSRYTGR